MKLLIALFLVLAPFPQPLYASNPSQAVFKLLVKSKNAPSAYIEGSAFVIATDGPPDNPTLYFLTSAHNFFTSAEWNEDPVSTTNITEVKVQYASGLYWQVDAGDISIEDHWFTQSKDVAVFRVRRAGKKVDPLIIKYSMPDDPFSKIFMAFGYPAAPPDSLQSTADGQRPVTLFDEPTMAQLVGAGSVKGSNCHGLNYAVQGTYDPGMSGGPVLFDENVVGVVSDSGPSNGYRCFQTLRIVREWIISLLPAYDHPETNSLGEGFYGITNTDSAKDQEIHLKQNCPDFKRIEMPGGKGSGTDICTKLKLKCSVVCDWLGNRWGCDGDLGGTRVAYCQTGSGPSANMGLVSPAIGNAALGQHEQPGYLHNEASAPFGIAINSGASVTNPTVNNTIVAPVGRVLAFPQYQELVAELKILSKGTVAIVAFEPITDEMYALADQLKDAFKDAGWSDIKGYKTRPFSRVVVLGNGPGDTRRSDPDGLHCGGLESSLLTQVIGAINDVGLTCPHVYPDLFPLPATPPTITIFIGRDLSR